MRKKDNKLKPVVSAPVIGSDTRDVVETAIDLAKKRIANTWEPSGYLARQFAKWGESRGSKTTK